MISKLINNVKWLKNKEAIKKQMDLDTHRIDVQNAEIAKLKHKLEHFEKIEENNNKYLKTIKEQRKEINRLKKEK